ncbi:MAG: bifunctional 4-hydroxy-2-oxoglutarate aldolase/2-dehydro-3-deoxy-phosphogluconate aldolase, partial [Bacillota bacterium]|nr:bifunctional 4-hydroxy-2-oxoglutarate aldolase/2-dehydro-3-deoxy-phosphogluconate aldolase [Bacillota bacterium]
PHAALEVIDTCLEKEVVSIPAGMTPTEIVACHQRGADMIKVFPCSSLGPKYIKELLAPLDFVSLVPTGGVGLENAAEYLTAGATALGIGGSLIDKELIIGRKEAEYKQLIATFYNLTRRLE